jgi:hypothetical protein
MNDLIFAIIYYLFVFAFFGFISKFALTKWKSLNGFELAGIFIICMFWPLIVAFWILKSIEIKGTVKE